jgi:flagellar basal-body rod protein FlgB
MDFSKIPLFQGLTSKMGWLSHRQQVLARNVANVNTPGYRPTDLTKPDFEEVMRESVGGGAANTNTAATGGTLQLVTTNPAHFGSSTDPGAEASEVKIQDPDAPKRPNGNGVDIERELMRVNKTAMDYELSTNIYRKYVAMFRMALGRGGTG